MSGLHFHRLTICQALPEADDAVVLSFDVPPDLVTTYAFSAGQYLTLRQVAAAPADVGASAGASAGAGAGASAGAGADLRRAYSICSAPGEPLRVGVRRVPGGAFSSGVSAGLRAGDALEVMPPLGRFGAALAGPSRPRHVLLVAGGSGITPLLSILKSVLRDEPDSRVTLLYGNRTAASTMFKEELEDLKNRHIQRLVLHMVFSREGLDSNLNSGRLDRDKLATLLRLAGPVAAVDLAFVCGPHALNEVAQLALLAQGWSSEQVHVERFGLPPTETASPLPQASASDAAKARITLVRDGVTREIAFELADHNILAAAARAGLDVPYSCKSGVCATCRAKLLAGQVRMERNFALEADEVKAGYVLTCQAHPLTDHVTLTFDER